MLKIKSTQLPLWTTDQFLARAAADTKQNQHNTRTNMSSAGFETLIPATKRLQTALTRVSTIKRIQIYSSSYQSPCAQCCWAVAVSVYQMVRWGCTYCIYWTSLPQFHPWNWEIIL